MEKYKAVSFLLKMSRYEVLKETIWSLKTDMEPRTYGWFSLHGRYLQDYYDNFEDFEAVHPDLDSDEFREKCRILNMLLYKLLKDYKTNQWFELGDYLHFNIVLLEAVDYVFANNDDDDGLADMFKSCTV